MYIMSCVITRLGAPKRILQFVKLDTTSAEAAGIGDAHVGKIRELNNARHLGLDGIISSRTLDLDPKLHATLEARASAGRTVQVA